MELSEAQQRARRAYLDELDMIAIRRKVAKTRNRLRKVSTAGGVEGLTTEAREELDWWCVRKLSTAEDVAEGMKYVVAMLGVGGGVDGYSALRAAGRELLHWFAATGRPVTATKFGSSKVGPATEGEARLDGNSYAPSEAVAFLAHHFVQLDPALDAEDPGRPGSHLATDAAFRVVRAYQAAHSG
jgi:hypothetical protein